MTRSRIFKETEQGQIDLFDLKVYFCLVSSLVISYYFIAHASDEMYFKEKTIVWKILSLQGVILVIILSLLKGCIIAL